MIKYEILKEQQNEVSTFSNDWNQNDFKEDYDCKETTYLETIASFNSLEEAKAYFENEKQYCKSFVNAKNGSKYIVLYDIIILAETEYYDDGELNYQNWIDTYAAPID